MSTATNYQGPYTPPSNCRKLLGITTRKSGRFDLQFAGYILLYSVNGITYTGDYGALWDSGRPFEDGRVDDLGKTFLWSCSPSITPNTYYWVYWKNPPSLTGLDQDSSLLITPAYHLNFAKCVSMWAKSFLEDASPVRIEDYLSEWLAELNAPYRDQKHYQNMTQSSGFPNGLI